MINYHKKKCKIDISIKLKKGENYYNDINLFLMT